MTHIVGSTRSERQSLFRAARRLNDLGLVSYLKEPQGDRGVYVQLTKLGAAVAYFYGFELREGQRIRWDEDIPVITQRALTRRGA
jgi:hypothetical protein